MIWHEARIMKASLILKIVAVFVCIFRRCETTNAQDASKPDSPAIRAQALLEREPVPAGLIEQGKRGEKTIRVVVYGPVNHPGIYYFSEGALMRDALQAAQKSPDTFWWSGSYVLRDLGTERVKIIPFSDKKTWLGVPLQEGDLLHLSYEVY